MIRKLAILSLFAACGVHGAIGQTDDQKPPEKAADKAEEKAAEKPAGPGLIEELRQRAQRDGGMLKLDAEEFAKILRGALEKSAVPADQLKNAGIPKLLELLKEKNPDFFKGMLLGGAPGMGNPFGPKLEKKLNDHFGELLDGHRPGTVVAAPATFLLRDGQKPAEPLAFATGVQADGWILTKASEAGKAAALQGQIEGEWLDAKVVRVWPDHDLALVKVAGKNLPVVKWSEMAAPDVGSFITAVAPVGRDPVAIGVVSVAARNARSKGRGFLGVSLTSDDIGLKVREVVPGGPAKASGLQQDDRILEIDGKKPDSVFNFTKMVSDRSAGDKVRLKFQRASDVMEKEIALGDRGSLPGTERPNKMNAMGSTVSKRKGDFASALQTDLPLEAAECGGPVTDLDGNVIGLVIARSGRVETMVVPSGTIRELLGGVDFSDPSTK